MAGVHLSGVICGVLPPGVDEGQSSKGYAAHYIETAVNEIKLLNKIVAANPNHSGRKHVVSLLDSFEHKGPNGGHVCMVFVAVSTCQRRETSSNPK